MGMAQRGSRRMSLRAHVVRSVTSALRRNLATLRHTFHAAPLPQWRPAPRPVRPVSWAWAGGVAALLCLLVWGATRQWSDVPRPAQGDAPQLGVVGQMFLELLASNEEGATERADGETWWTSSLDMLMEEGGCTGYEAFFNPECSEQGWALVAGEL